jgi:hypothetical protein
MRGETVEVLLADEPGLLRRMTDGRAGRGNQTGAPYSIRRVSCSLATLAEDRYRGSPSSGGGLSLSVLSGRVPGEQSLQAKRP